MGEPFSSSGPGDGGKSAKARIPAPCNEHRRMAKVRALPKDKQRWSLFS